MRPETKALYPKNWKAVSANIKEDRHYCCQGCGQIGNKPRNPLTVHHVDYNPANNDPLNLLLLCAKCHLRVQQGRPPYLQRIEHGQLFLENFYEPPNSPPVPP